MTAQNILVPTLGESITEATLARWTHKSGDYVTADALLAEIETDKITLEITAPVSGVLENVTAAEGATVRVGDVIASIRPGDAPEKQIAKTSTETTTTTTPSPERFDATSAPKTSKNSLYITKDDYLDTLLSPTTTPQPATAPQPTPVQHEERVPMSRLRLRIAAQLKEAQNTAALLSTFNEINMAAVMDVRAQNKDAFEAKYKVRLGFMSFFVRAAVRALRQFPVINAELAGTDIVFKNYYNIGVAVGTDRGLVVPTLRHAETMDLATIEATIAALAQKAKNKQLLPEDLTGGTFTISNGGVYGSLLSTPIINPPQSAILGLHAIQKRPIAEGDSVVIRPMMYTALSYDHRLIDGKEAVSFLKHIKESMENPGSLLLDL
jgi:2-oxoglutarate dehydrogenase E2 component (dihydrolipoamide succinyltransferase)